MEEVIAVCGQWLLEKERWMFHVDKRRGSKVIPVTDNTTFEDMINMVYEDYGLDKRSICIELSYMLSRKSLLKLTLDTPPVRIGNFRQLQGFFRHLKSDHVRLCVEVTCRVNRKTMEKSTHGGVVNQSDPSPAEDSDTDGERFDYCDDSDGATSDDEDFIAYGVPPGVDINTKKWHTPKVGLATTLKKTKAVTTHVRQQLSSLNIVVGQSFESKSALKTRLQMLTVVQQFDYDVDYSTPDLLVVKCWVRGCSWKLRASPTSDSPHFTIRGYVSEHTCSVTERSARCRQATPEILGALYTEFIGGVEPSILPSHVMQSLNMCFGIKIDYWKAHRTLQYARELVRGSAESGYHDLPAYLHMIREANPGTFTRLEVDSSDRFKYLFLAFGASIKGFPFMRKVVVVDGTFLQGKYKGTLLIASSQDGNFQIFPIAFAIVDTENDESWKWFFRQFNCVIPDDEKLAIISDRHKSIGNAITHVYPKASRGVCTYHLYKNVLGKFRGRELFGLVKKAANSYRLSDFETIFEEIKSMHPALHGYLHKADVRKWARAHFPGDRYNLTTTNIAESINRVLSDARSLPVVRLLEAIRQMMTRWFSTRKNDAYCMKTTLTRGVEKLLEVNMSF
ncbi:uncharacterized protein LOC103839683 [Brassica rapa]|uniref:uncharacterized protein LOC103839683 n=1 Tax=Brassica campestris TaxID=3711 RepID=UPI0004F17926|nr:uncharacterized protein LOC103839683 [Brassica rapa]